MFEKKVAVEVLYLCSMVHLYPFIFQKRGSSQLREGTSLEEGSEGGECERK